MEEFVPKNENGEPIGLTFPCTMPLKIIGENSPEFEKEVFATLSRHIAGVTPEQFSDKQSSGSKYRSISFTFTAESREQCDAIYRELTANPKVKWVL